MTHEMQKQRTAILRMGIGAITFASAKPQNVPYKINPLSINVILNQCHSYSVKTPLITEIKSFKRFTSFGKNPTASFKSENDNINARETKFNSHYYEM